VTDDRSPTELSQLFCFDLYAASRAVTALYRSVLADVGLTYPQYLVMVVLWRERSCGIKQIAEDLRLDYGTLTPLLRRLEVSGLITRERRSDDERAVRLGLTPAGSALQESAWHIPELIRGAAGLDGLQAAALQVTLRAVTRAVTSYVAVPGAG